MPKQFKKADWKCNLSHFQSAALFLSVTGLKPTDQFQVTGLIRIKLTGRHLRNFRHIPGFIRKIFLQFLAPEDIAMAGIQFFHSPDYADK